MSDLPPADRDPLAAVGERLAGLEEQPVSAHPDALEAVHRAVVAELDALTGVGSAGRDAAAPTRTDGGC